MANITITEEEYVATLKEIGDRRLAEITGIEADTFGVLRRIVSNKVPSSRFVNVFMQEMTDAEFLQVAQAFRGLKLIEDVIFGEESLIGLYDNDNVSEVLREAAKEVKRRK